MVQRVATSQWTSPKETHSVMADVGTLVGRVLRTVELIAGAVAGLLGIADVVRLVYVSVVSPGGCYEQNGRCVSPSLGEVFAFDGFLVLLSVLVVASAYVHARWRRLIGLVGLWLITPIFYVLGILSLGGVFVYPFLFTLATALVGTLSLLFRERPSLQGTGP